MPTSPAEPSAAQTGAAQTGTAQTGAAQTGAAQTGAVQTGAAQTGAAQTAPSAAHAGIDALSYEEARDELVRVVAELERGAATLEQSLGLWERGEALAARCEEWLIGAKTRLDAARAGSSGTRGEANAE